MRFIRPLFVLAASIVLTGAAAESDMIGRYRLDEGHEAAGELLLTADGRFQYALAYGALDERAEGRWRLVEGRTCLFTEPAPKPPVFVKAPLLPVDGGPAGDGVVPTLLVTWPDGRGIPGVDFRIGFDTGEPVQDYTQEYGWTLPGDETRPPRWVEFNEPIHRVPSPRFTLTPADKGKLRVILEPNDIGVVDFAGACLERQGDQVILHRSEGPMRFVRLRK